MQKTIYICDQCLKEIGKVTHITLNVEGNGRTSGIALPPGTKGSSWYVQEMPKNWFHLHIGCVEKYFSKIAKLEVKKK